MRGGQCSKVHHRPLSCCLHFSSHQSIARCWLRIAICLPHLHSTLPLGGPCRNIAMTFSMLKLEWFGYPTVKIFWRYDYSFQQSLRMWQTNRQMDGQTDTTCSIGRTALMHSIAILWLPTCMLSPCMQFKHHNINFHSFLHSFKISRCGHKTVGLRSMNL